MNKKLMLIVDDNVNETRELSDFFVENKYDVLVVRTAEKMHEILESERKVSIILLETALPDENGLEVCKSIRRHYNLPIIFLTKNKALVDKIVGLELGADDYQIKPCDKRELLARVSAVVRRYQKNVEQFEWKISDISKKDTIYMFLEWKLNCSSRVLYSPDGKEVLLTAGEYDLLKVFLENPQRVLSRDNLLDLTRGRVVEPFDRSIDVQVSRLRTKIEEDSKKPKMIKTIRNGGYMFAVSVV